MHHTATRLKWKTSALFSGTFVIPKEPNWPLATAASSAEITSPSQSSNPSQATMVITG
ncbi:uncharacterized protein PpBr36_10115, partial [Pyricularia pennisetigena]|uniref:uncharacterized protein n=1 Tax=Pyricularia pennisetigena TaxID=1578925 RepID=UPI001153DB52